MDLSEEEALPRPKATTDEEKSAEQEVDWKSYIPGVQRVLHMTVSPLPLLPRHRLTPLPKPAEHLAFLVDSLRVEHLYCFWCAAKYGSVQEMEGPGGCPGTEEDDH